MKKLTYLLLAILTGCDMNFGIDPNLNTDVRYLVVFEGQLNGVKTSFNNAVFECREPELFIYRRPTELVPEPAGVFNKDGSLITCTTDLFYKAFSEKSNTMVVVE